MEKKFPEMPKAAFPEFLYMNVEFILYFFQKFFTGF